MRSTRVLPLLVVIPLLNCDGTGDSLRTPGAASAYAAPLASDTTVVSVRRVWSSGPTNDFDVGTIMPNGTGTATTEWITGDPGILNLASREFRRFRMNDEPWDSGYGVFALPSTDGNAIAVGWENSDPEYGQLRIVDVARGESRTIMSQDPAIGERLIPVAWTPAGDSVFVSHYPSPNSQDGDVNVMLISAAGGTARRVHTIPIRAGPHRMSLSPDGRWLLYAHEPSRDEQRRSDIYIIDVQNGGARPLVEHPAIDLLVGWLPGTDVVLFSSDRSGTTDLWSVRVVNGRAIAEARLVRSGFFRSEAIGFGDDALFYRVGTGSSGPAVVDVDPQSGAILGTASPPLADLPGNYQALAWSPDGEALAAAITERRRYAIAVRSIRTGDTRKFWLDEDVDALVIQWAADGTAIFLRAGDVGERAPTGPHRFLRLDLATGATTRLFAAEDPAEPGRIWPFLATPDGRSIVLRQQRTLDDGRTEFKIVLRSLEDGDERELHRTLDFIPEFSISADGTYLAFMQQVWEDSDSLFIMRMDASQPPRAVASWNYDVVSLLGWLPAGNALITARLTEDGTAEEILRVELDGSVTIAGLSPFTPRRGFQGSQGAYRSRLLLSPAGNRLVTHVSDFGSELWRMDGLHELFAGDASGRR